MPVKERVAFGAIFFYQQIKNNYFECPKFFTEIKENNLYFHSFNPKMQQASFQAF